MAIYRHKFLALQTEDGYGIYSGVLPVPMDGSSDYTWTAWIYQKQENDDEGSILYVDEGCGLYVHGNAVAYEMEGYPRVETSPVLKTECWMHIAVTYKKSGFLKLYVDGELIKASSVSGSGQKSGGECSFGEEFNGYIRSIKLYSEVLGNEEILDEMMSPEEKKENLKASFSFSRTSPVEEITGGKITLCGKCNIVQIMPCALFEQGSGVWFLQNEGINPGGNDRPYTIQTWIYLKPTGDAIQTVFENFHEMLPYGMSLFLERSGQSYYARLLHGSIEQKNNLLVSETALAFRSWINLAVTFDGAVARIYINGVLDCVNNNLTETVEYAREGNIRIGSDAPDGNYHGENWFRGGISRMEIWNRALTLQEIKNYMLSQPDNMSEELVAELDFMSEIPIDLTKNRSLAWVQLQTGGQIVQEAEKDFQEYNRTERKRNYIRKATENDRRRFEAKKDKAVAVLERCRIESEGMEEYEEKWGNAEKQTFQQSIEDIIEQIKNGEFVPVQVFEEKAEDGGLDFCIQEENEIYLMLHYTPEELADMTPYDIWCVQLVIIILCGIVNIVFGTKMSSIDDGIKAFARNYLCNGTFLSLIKKLVTSLSLGAVWGVIKYFTTSKLWSAILRLIFGTAIFWTLLRMIGKMVANYTSGALWIHLVADGAAMMAAIAVHCADIPEKNAPLTLLQVSFSFDSAAIALRKTGKDKKIVPPQWEKEGEDSSKPFAYSLKKLNETKKVVFVAQVDCRKSGEYYIRIKSDTASGVLGEVEKKKVTLDETKQNGCQVYLDADKLNLDGKGFGKEKFEWTWQCSTDDKTYMDFAKTAHTVYLIPEAPSAPWNAEDGIWINVMDDLYKHIGTQTGYDLKAKRKLIGKIAEYLYDGEGFQYDISGQKDRYVKGDICELSQYLKERNYSATEHKMGPKDPAALLVAMANMIGGNLTAKQLADNQTGNCVALQTVIPIGNTVPVTEMVVKNYEVACEDELQNGKEIVTDACMKINFSQQPEKEDYHLAESMELSGTKGTAYLPSAVKNPQNGILLSLDGSQRNGKRIVK